MWTRILYLPLNTQLLSDEVDGLACKQLGTLCAVISALKSFLTTDCHVLRHCEQCFAITAAVSQLPLFDVATYQYLSKMTRLFVKHNLMPSLPVTLRLSWELCRT